MQGFKKARQKDFFEGLESLAFLNLGLHPDGFSEPDSGWTEELKPFGAEAWRRFDSGEITSSQLYPWQEAMKGLEARKNEHQRLEY